MGATRKIPQRQCIGCQEMKNKKDLIRVLRTCDGEIVVDTTGKKNGRGAYLCKNADCLKKAIKTKSLERSLKVNIMNDVYEQLEKELDNIETR